MEKKTYAFRLNANPTSQELDEALAEIYALTVRGAKDYESQCPVGFEELGSYVFNRVLTMLNTDCTKAGLAPSWRTGLKLWMSEVSWKTAPSYIRRMLSSGFIDYTRSFYSEFKHKPTDPQESLYVFDRPNVDEFKVSIGDVQEGYARLSTEERKVLPKKFALDKMAFSEEFRQWFDGICDPKVISINTVYDLSLNQVHQIRAGRLAFKFPDGTTFLNVLVSERNKTLLLRPY